MRKKTEALMNDAKITFIEFILFLIRNPHPTMAMKPVYTTRLNPFPIKRSEIAIDAMGIMNASLLSWN